MVKKLSLCVVSLLLCFCIICNSSTFRRDTYAFAPVAVVAWVAVSLVASAAGIYFANAHDTEDYKQWCKDCAEWLSDRGDDVEDILSGQIFVDIAGKYIFSETGFKTLANLIVEWTQSDDYKSKYGDITLPSFTADIGSFANIRTYYYGLQQDLAASNYSYIFDIDTKDPDYYSLPYRVSQYEYYDIYTYVKPVGSGNYLEDYTVLFFACLCYNSDGDYVIYSNYIHHGLNYGTAIEHSQSSQHSSGSDFSSCFDDKINFGFNHNRLYYSLSEMQQVAHFVNTDVIEPSDEDTTIPSSTSPVELDEDNAVTNPQYITNVINNYGTVVEGLEGTEGTDVTYVPVYYPAYEDTGNVIEGNLPGLTVPDVLTGTEGVTGVIPGTIEGVTDVPGSGTVDDSFIDGLVSAITSAIVGQFTLPEGYWDDWFDKFKFAWESKGLSVDFSFLEREFSEIRIPDVYINWQGKEYLIFESQFIYDIADSVKGYIRALIYFLLLLHDRKRIIFIIRGAVPPDGDEISNGI